MGIAGAFLAGVLVGVILAHRRIIGSLRIDMSESEKRPYLFLEFHRDCIPNLSHKKYVTLKVDPTPYISRE